MGIPGGAQYCWWLLHDDCPRPIPPAGESGWVQGRGLASVIPGCKRHWGCPLLQHLARLVPVSTLGQVRGQVQGQGQVQRDPHAWPHPLTQLPLSRPGDP